MGGVSAFMFLPFRPQISKGIGVLTGSWKNLTHVLHSFTENVTFEQFTGYKGNIISPNCLH